MSSALPGCPNRPHRGDSESLPARSRRGLVHRGQRRCRVDSADQNVPDHWSRSIRAMHAGVRRSAQGHTSALRGVRRRWGRRAPRRAVETSRVRPWDPRNQGRDWPEGMYDAPSIYVGRHSAVEVSNDQRPIAGWSVALRDYGFVLCYRFGRRFHPCRATVRIRPAPIDTIGWPTTELRIGRGRSPREPTRSPVRRTPRAANHVCHATRCWSPDGSTGGFSRVERWGRYQAASIRSRSLVEERIVSNDRLSGPARSLGRSCGDFIRYLFGLLIAHLAVIVHFV